jgi:hypothetical protein
VIRFALRLSLRGGRDALTRLVLIAVAVTLGVGLLLTTLAGINAVNRQNARYGWLEADSGAHQPAQSGRPSDPVWFDLTADRFHGHVIGRVDVAATGPHSPVPPGVTSLPGPGQYYASPAMIRLLRRTPANELADRYPGRLAGTVGAAALPAPNSLVVLIGRTPAELAADPHATQIARFSTTSPSSCNGDCAFVGINAHGIDLVLSVITAALLFPVLIFIATATRLSAARREQRFAAMRLVGATPRQITVISTVESTVAAVIGVAGGFGLFYALRPVLAPIPFTGAPFFVSDLALNLRDVLLVAAGVPIGAAVAARLALRRVTISPLGVTRRVTPSAPRAWRLLPLAAGLAELGYFVAAGRPGTTGGQIQAFLPGILVTLVGLVIAGPYLTRLGSRFLARRAARPAALIAARRLSDNPQAGFRAISGLVVALFVTSVATSVIAAVTADKAGMSSTTAADRSTMIADLRQPSVAGAPTTSAASVPAWLPNELRSTPGVTSVLLVHEQPTTGTDLLSGVVDCTALSSVPALGRCAAGAQTAMIEPFLAGTRFAPKRLPQADVTTAALGSLPVQSVAVATNGSTAAIERARTLFQHAFPHQDVASTIAENQSQDSWRIAAYQRLADVVIIASLPIAGCTLAVSVLAGLNERKRPFSLLRLTGVPLRVLRRVVLLESTVPLALASAFAIGTGFLTAFLFLRSQLSEPLRSPGAAYYGVVVAGLVASVAIIASTLPVLRRITGPETARND